MSNKELEKYKQLYSDLISAFIELHNKHLHIMKWDDSRNAGIQIRGVIKEIQLLTVELKKQTKLVYLEGLKNKKEDKIQQRELRKRASLNKKRKYKSDHYRGSLTETT